MAVISSNTEAYAEYRIFKRRWLILVIFCLISLTNAFQWIQYSIIESAIVEFYGVDSVAVDWTSMIYMLTYIPFVFPSTYLLDRYGLRLCGLLGGLGTCAGAWIKCGSVARDRFAVTFVGQTVSGLAQVFVLGIPPRLAAVWFGPSEVSTATSIGVMGNQVGIAIGFYVPTALVSNATDPDGIAKGLEALFYGTAGFTSFVCIIALIAFSNAPPVPPSPAQAAAIKEGVESDYLKSLKTLVTNWNYLILVAAYGLNAGVFYAVSTFLSQILQPYFPGSESIIGIIGFAIVIAGMIGSIVCGFALDKTHRFKLITLLVYICSVAGMLAFSLTIYTYQIWIVFAAACFLGFFMTGYLPVGFEFGAELTYPCSEGTQSGLLNASAQVFGIILVLGMGAVLRTSSALACNMTMSGMLVIGAVLTVFIKSDLRRQRANQNHPSEHATVIDTGTMQDGTEVIPCKF